MKNTHDTLPVAIKRLEIEDVEAFTGALIMFWEQTEDDWEIWNKEREIEDALGAQLIRQQRKLGQISLYVDYDVDASPGTYVPLAS